MTALLEAFVTEGNPHDVHAFRMDDDDDAWFNVKDIAKVLGIANLHQALYDVDERDKLIVPVHTETRGVQDALFVRETIAYRLVMRSRKPVAVPFQNFLAAYAKRVRKELEDARRVARTSEAEQEVVKARAKESELLREIAKYKTDNARPVHDSLIIRYAQQPVVYFALFALPDGTRLTKLGSTRDLETRAYGLKMDWGPFAYKEAFRCERYVEFERFLHNKEHFKKRAFDGLINGRRSREMYHFDDDELDTALEIARRNAHKFQERCESDRQTNVASADGSRRSANDEIAKLMRMFETTSENQKRMFETTSENQNQAMQALAAKLDAALGAGEQHHETCGDRQHPQTQPTATQPPSVVFVATPSADRRFTQARGNKIQRYSADGATLLRTYVGVKDATRDPELDAPTEVCIKRACAERTPYKGFRWAELARAAPDDTVLDIGPTNDAPNAYPNQGHVAMLDLSKTSIVRVFADQREAAEDRCFRGTAAVATAIKLGRKSGGHFFAMWRDCPEDLRSAYLAGGGQLPQPRPHPGAIRIEQLHPITEEVLRTYSAVAHITRDHRMSRDALQRAMDGNYVKNGFKWRQAS